MIKNLSIQQIEKFLETKVEYIWKTNFFDSISNEKDFNVISLLNHRSLNVNNNKRYYWGVFENRF